MIELVVPIHPALEDLWRLFENPPAKELAEGSVFSGTELIKIRDMILRAFEWPVLLDYSEERRLRRWRRHLGRLHRSRERCLHGDILRVMWSDWSVTPLCADCGHQGHPMPVPAVADTLVIPRDLKELLARTGLRSIEREHFSR